MRNHLYLLAFLLLLLYSCDGAFKVSIVTVENNSVSGLFERDTIVDGQLVPNVNILINLAGKEKGAEAIQYRLKTDSTGMLSDGLPVPPLKKTREFEGYLTWNKEGYLQDTIFFNHSSVDKRVAVINMERLR